MENTIKLTYTIEESEKSSVENEVYFYDYDDNNVAVATTETLNLSGGSALKTAVAALEKSGKIISSGANVTISNITTFVGDIFETLKAIVGDIRAGVAATTSAPSFVSAIKSLKTNVWDPISKRIDKVGSIFGLAASMASHSNAISKVSNDVTQFGYAKQESLDDYAFSGIDVIKNIVNTAAFFFPVGLLGKGAFTVITTVAATGFKSWYIKSAHKDMKTSDAIIASLPLGLDKLIGKIKSFFKEKTDDYDDVSDDVKNADVITDSDTGVTYNASTEGFLTVTEKNGNAAIFNISEVVKNITATGSAEVYNYSDGVTITGDGAGNTIYNYGNDVTIECNGGNDTVYNMGDNVTIKGVTSQNRIYSTGENVQIIELVDGNNTIETGDGNDTIKVNDRGETDTEKRYYNKIYAGDGNNYIYNSNVERSTISAGSGNDTIITGGGDYYSSSTRTSINAGDGDNQIKINTSISHGIIIAGNGRDYVTIEGNGNNNAISLGGGSDHVIIGGNNSTINVGSGGNGITLTSNAYGNNVIAGGGDDLIYMKASANGNRLSLGGGKNYVAAAGGYHTIIAGDDKDYVYVSGGYIDVGGGNNTVLLGNSPIEDTSQNASMTSGNTTVIAGGGNDTIRVADKTEDFGIRYSNNINAGDGNNYIYNSNVERSTISAGSGNDTIISGGGGDTYYSGIFYHTSINAGNGDNQITVNSAMNRDTIIAGEGNDYVTIAGNGNSNAISLGGGNDSFVGGVSSSTINVGIGANKVTLNANSSNNYIIAGQGADYVTMASSSTGNTISLGSGNNTVIGIGGNQSVYSNAGDDVITVGGGYVNVGDGKNDISLSTGGNSQIISGNEDDTIRVADKTEDFGIRYSNNINAGDGNNYIYNSNVERSTISAGSGNDTIISGGGGDTYYSVIFYHTSINAGNGDNQITVNSAMNRDTIIAGEGNDYVTIAGNGNFNAISLGGGNDSFVGGVSSSTINVGSGDDFVSLNIDSSRNTFWLGGGNDVIRLDNAAGYHTITGGAGNDTIYSNKNSNVFRYTSGEGNDVIVNMTSSDTLIIGNGTGTYSKATDGDDLILKIAEGFVKLKDAAKLSTIKIQGTFMDEPFNVPTTLPSGEDTTSGGSSTIPSSGDTIPDGMAIKNGTLTATKNFTDGTIDLNENWTSDVKKVNLASLSQNLSITVKDSATSVKSGKGADTISGGSAKDTINGGLGNDLIYGNEDNDLLKGDAGIDTLDGGTGTNTLTGGAGKDVFVHSEGDDIITDYTASQDKIMVNSITGDSLKGSDVILFTDNGNITVKGGKNKKITIVDGENNSTTKVYGQYNYSESNTKLTLTSGFNGTLNADDYDSAVEEINATAITKSGKIFGNENNNVIIGSARNDSINGNGGDNTLTGGNGNDVFIHESGDDVITDYTVGKDKIKLLNVTITSASLDENNLILQTTDGTITVAEGKGKKITVVDAKNKTTTAEYPLFLEGLTYDKKNILLTATADFTGETIDLTDYYSTTTKVNANAVKTAIEIYGNDSSNSIKGGKGSDTIYGGAGNDTLTGGTGKDVFVYEKGDDVITDYKAGQDTIKLENVSITGSTIKSSNVILQTDEGTLTVKSGRNKKITVIDSSGNETTQVYGNSFNYESAQLIEEDLLSDFVNETDMIFQNENAAAIDELNLYQNLNATNADVNFDLLNYTPPTAYQQETHYYKNYATYNA